MSDKVNQAVENHKNGFSCSGSVLCAFCGDAGMSQTQAKLAAMPMAGGRMIKCGAVLAAEAVLKKRFPDRAHEMTERFENEFFSRNKSVNCRELKGRDTGVMLRSCRGCVTDAAEILDSMLEQDSD